MSNCFFLPQSVSSENSPEDPERLQAAVCYSPITLDQAGHPLPTSFSRSLALAGNQQIAQGQGVHLCALEAVDGLFGAADNRLVVVKRRVQHDGHTGEVTERGNQDRKSTRLNSSHLVISYAVF